MLKRRWILGVSLSAILFLALNFTPHLYTLAKYGPNEAWWLLTFEDPVVRLVTFPWDFERNRHYPLRVWVDGDGALWDKAQLAAYSWELELLGYSELWDRDNKGTIFVFVDNKAKADIVIAAKDRYSFEFGRQCVLAGWFSGLVCLPKLSGSPVIVLVAKEILSLEGEAYGTLLHEFGHAAFGLEHSRKPSSIMCSGDCLARGIENDDLVAAKEYLRKHGVSVP